jgi:signal transduction histidine kinase
MALPDRDRGLEPGVGGLWLGVLIYRWASYSWMAILAAVTRDDLRHATPALILVAVLGVWNAWFTLAHAWERRPARFLDLAISAALLPLSGWVMAEGTAGGESPFFATAYPAASALTVGIGEGVVGGLSAGVVLSIALALSRPVNGIALTTLTTGEWASLVNGFVYYVSAGGAAGAVSRALSRSAREREAAMEEATRERERAARLAERETLGRDIHDSVLQSLALIGKRGKELVGSDSPPPRAEVEELVELAGRQERALRALLSEPPETPPSGYVSLRTALQAAAYATDGVPVSVSMSGHIWMPAEDVERLAAAARQALDNAAIHAKASRVTIFAEKVDGLVEVSIRDDGVGFVYDEEQMASEGKMGLLRSMKGRIEEMGGTMAIHTSPGAGTEVEFRVMAGGDAASG